MSLKSLLLALVAVLFSINALVAEETATAEVKEPAAKVECTGKITCTKSADGTSCTNTITCEDGTSYTICNKCEGCKKACEQSGKTVKAVGKCEDGKVLCLESCEECKPDAVEEAPAK